jgi:hypothetical protein
LWPLTLRINVVVTVWKLYALGQEN